MHSRSTLALIACLAYGSAVMALPMQQNTFEIAERDFNDFTDLEARMFDDDFEDFELREVTPAVASVVTTTVSTTTTVMTAVEEKKHHHHHHHNGTVPAEKALAASQPPDLAATPATSPVVPGAQANLARRATDRSSRKNRTNRNRKNRNRNRKNRKTKADAAAAAAGGDPNAAAQGPAGVPAATSADPSAAVEGPPMTEQAPPLGARGWFHDVFHSKKNQPMADGASLSERADSPPAAEPATAESAVTAPMTSTANAPEHPVKKISKNRLRQQPKQEKKRFRKARIQNSQKKVKVNADAVQEPPAVTPNPAAVTPSTF